MGVFACGVLRESWRLEPLRPDDLRRWLARLPDPCTSPGFPPVWIPSMPSTASRSRRRATGVVVVMSRAKDSTGSPRSPPGAYPDSGNQAGEADTCQAAGPLDPACGAPASPHRGARAL